MNKYSGADLNFTENSLKEFKNHISTNLNYKVI